MAEQSPNARWISCVAMALAAALLWGHAAQAQEDPIETDTAVLDSKAVAKLLINDDPPDFPAIAKVNFIQGEVRIRLFVSREGRVSKVHAIKGHPFLVVSAIEAVRKWTYKPYHVGKRPVEFTTLVSIRFALHPKVLTDLPPSAERDLEARVEPPKIADQPADPPSDTHVRLRILVDSEGHALDTQRISGSETDARAAEQEITQWRFLPAHWGSLPVPWYLDVDVPVHHAPA